MLKRDMEIEHTEGILDLELLIAFFESLEELLVEKQYDPTLLKIQINTVP